MTMWTAKSVRADHVDFARRAAEFFRANPSKYTFTDGDLSVGEPLAIKWAFDADRVFSVAVVEISSAVLVEEP